MSFIQWNKRLRLGLALLASGAMLGLDGPVWAQAGFNAQYREEPGNALSRHLKTLADSPRNLSALTGAAKAALDLGDPQAAVTFFARAEEISPRDGRIKAGIGSAFVAMEQPQPALRFFEEARGLGAPEGEYAADRGLAYDLLGDPAQAQRDYQLAMRTQDGDELRRRLALSRAISGDRAGALAAIDGQLRRQDRAAWRVRAFVLALTGDANGATEATRSVMPQQAAAMQPFFARLPSLRPAERALAVHFGRFPGDGVPASAITPQSYAGLATAPSPILTDAGRPTAAQPSFGRALPGGAAPALTGAPDPLRAGSGTLRTRPVPAPTQVAVPAATIANASGRSDTNLAQRRNQEVRGGAPTQTARAEMRAPVPVSQRATAPDPRMRGSGSMAQDRASGIYTRAERDVTASAAGRPQVQAPPSQIGGRQQVAALDVRPPLARPPLAGVTSPASAAAMVPSEVPPARPSSLVPTGPVQGPPSPSGAAPVASASVSPGSPVKQPALAATPAVVPAATPPQAIVPARSGVTELSETTVAIGSASLPPSVLAGPGATSTSAATAAGVAPPPAITATKPPPATVLSAALADVAATIRALPTAEPEKIEPAPAPAKPAAKAESVATPVAKAEPVKATAPSRHWVQIAGAADKASLRGEYARLSGKAPKLFADKSAWTSPLRYTNRLLVGPFDSENQAQGFVNELAKAELAAFSWTSPAGQAIEKLATK